MNYTLKEHFDSALSELDLDKILRVMNYLWREYHDWAPNKESLRSLCVSLFKSIDSWCDMASSWGFTVRRISEEDWSIEISFSIEESVSSLYEKEEKEMITINWRKYVLLEE